MSLTDSEPNFRARATALGLDEADVQALCNNGVNTLAKYAFSSAYVPGNSDESPFVQAMTTALGADPTLGQLASLRRLFHEAYSLTAAELKHSVERVEDMPVKKLAQPERADRLKRQQLKLKGIRIEGKLEPSDRLVDLAVSLYEENRLQHIELSRCTSKEQEVLNSSQRDDKHVAIDASGAVRIRDKESKMEADLSSDMFVRLALMRRGLALDQANLLDYLEHDRWVEKIFDCRVAGQPDGYAKISMQQIINADRKLFVKLAEGTRSGVQTTGAGRPLDQIFRATMEHPDVLHLLQPLPTAASNKRSSDSSYDKPDTKVPRPKTKGKGKAKGQQGTGSLTIKMPAGLEGGTPGNRNNQPICFDYNLPHGCKLPVTKGRCRKGMHICCVKNCLQSGHTFQSCPSKRSN